MAKANKSQPEPPKINLPLEVARRTGEGLSIVSKKIADFADQEKLYQLAEQRNYDLIIDLINPANKAQ
jgi:hypothetical protein